MNTKFEASFEKDVKKVRDRTILQTIKESILEVKQAKTIRDIANVKKLKGYETYYRIRCSRYRIGVEIIDDTVIFYSMFTSKRYLSVLPEGIMPNNAFAGDFAEGADQIWVAFHRVYVAARSARSLKRGIRTLPPLLEGESGLSHAYFFCLVRSRPCIVLQYTCAE